MKFMLALVLSGAFCVEASACSCPSFSFDEFVDNAGEIYLARLKEAKLVDTDPKLAWPIIHARFEVRQTLKGAPHTGDMTLTTGLGGGDCGVPMLVAATYIIFKNAGDTGIGDCDGSRALTSLEQTDTVAKVQAAMKRRRAHKALK
ncbi:MAG: hypothetical protein ACJ8HI_15875 [Massilia sp.]